VAAEDRDLIGAGGVPDEVKARKDGNGFAHLEQWLSCFCSVPQASAFLSSWSAWTGDLDKIVKMLAPEWPFLERDVLVGAKIVNHVDGGRRTLSR
jgi:hypothetical protein